MYEQKYGGVDLRKAVYALKCPVCGAECRSKENGECPYCGAYLDFGDFNSQPRQNAGVSMQTYDAPPIQPYQPYPPYQQPNDFKQPQLFIPPEEAMRRLDSWKKGRFTAYLIYCVIAVVSIFGGTVLNEGDRFYDLVMGICVLGYFPLSFFLPIVIAATRPDDCIQALNMPKPIHKVLSWLIYTIGEFGLMFALTVLVTLIF